MDMTALLLSRLQFAFTVSFHIIFPRRNVGWWFWETSPALIYWPWLALASVER
jgi:cytochrome bd ubiquinol oxidase subunit I